MPACGGSSLTQAFVAIRYYLFFYVLVPETVWWCENMYRMLLLRIYKGTYIFIFIKEKKKDEKCNYT